MLELELDLELQIVKKQQGFDRRGGLVFLGVGGGGLVF
jgi:hypothetical protein